MLVPIYLSARGNGNGAVYNIAGFAAFLIQSWNRQTAVLGGTFEGLRRSPRSAGKLHWYRGKLRRDNRLLGRMTPRLTNSGHQPHDERGQALVELAIVLVPLMLIIVAIVQFGFWFQARSALRDGVRAAARQASLCRSTVHSDPD